jgi:uncharacterized protein YdhG (YjbR/CyaY superfamily)
MADNEKNFSAEEREAMKEAAADKRKSRSRAKKSPEEVRAEGIADLEVAVAKLTDDKDRELSLALHALVTEVAPELMPRTYYGMPAWGKDGKVLCFFQPASKFKVRYGTFGFEPISNLDDGTVWPTAYAVTDLTKSDLEFLAERIRQAIS